MEVLTILSAALFLYQPVSAVTTVSSDFKSMTVSGSNLVALDFSSNIFTSSDDGVNFTLRETTSDVFEDVAGFGSTAIVVGIDGLVLRSSNDGVSWSAATNPDILNGTLSSVAGRADGANPNIWLAVGDDGFDGVVYRSLNDGQNWALVSTETAEILADVIWTGNRWLICGRDDFTNIGVVKSSADGVTWTSSSLPSDSQPLSAIQSDGSGVVVAVGELGEILRSTDDGLTFSRIGAQFNGGGDFNAVVADSSGAFFVGGDEKQILSIAGTSVSIEVPAAANAATIEELVLVNDEAAAVGMFSSSGTRTVPFAVTIATGGTADFVLSVSESLLGRTYYLETTTDLTQVSDTWTIVSGTSVSGNGGVLTFDVAEVGDRRFWRVVEF
ncbi:MAG: hypothetical protein AAGH40_03775 [Verrucomicrobiota bacterium]